MGGELGEYCSLQKKNLSAQQFKGSRADVTKSDVGLLCCWCTPIPGSLYFQMLKESSTFSHCYHSLKKFTCSLTCTCFTYYVNDGETVEKCTSIMPVRYERVQLSNFLLLIRLSHL